MGFPDDAVFTYVPLALSTPQHLAKKMVVPDKRERYSTRIYRRSPAPSQREGSQRASLSNLEKDRVKELFRPDYHIPDGRAGHTPLSLRDAWRLELT